MKTLADIKAKAEDIVKRYADNEIWTEEIKDQRTILALCEIVDLCRRSLLTIDDTCAPSMDYCQRVASMAIDDSDAMIAKIGEI